MDQEQKPPSFLDDPDLDAQLAALDQGPRRLPTRSDADADSAPSAPASGARAAFPSTQSPAAGPPRSIFPESAFTRAPSSRFSRAAAADAPGAGESEPRSSETTRPLLELFPPPPIPDRQAASFRGATGDAPAPRVVNRPAQRRVEQPPASAAPLTCEAFYGLVEKPFTLSTDPKFVYHSASHDDTTTKIADALERREAVVLLTGEPGIGKTTLCRALVEQLGRRRMASLVAEPVGSFEDLLKLALIDFGAINREEATRGGWAVATRQELTTALGDLSASLPVQGAPLIVVDDAQNVSADVLAPLADLARADRSRVQILLVGPPALGSQLAEPEFRPLQLLVKTRCRLAPLTADETAGYVAHRLAIAGVKPRVEFDARALVELHEATGGVPRLINLVCDRALGLGFAASSAVIDDGMILAAAADLGLVPVEPESRGALRKTVIVLVVLASLIAGAAAAAWLFRADLSRLVGQWRG